MKTIRLILADDHALIRDGLTKILSLEERIKIVGEAAEGEEAIRLARELKPDLVLMDINMPGMGGIEASKRIKEELPETEIIILTIHEDEEYISELIRCGVAGYLLKDISADDLIRSVLQVAAGEPVFHPRVTRQMMGEFLRLRQAAPEEHLTPRELEVLTALVRGEANREIATNLFISEKTVKNHLTSIFRKLDVSDRTQAALYAVKHRLVRQ